jgi:hypothetical protein
VVLAEVRRDVLVPIDPREADPGLVVLLIVRGLLDVHAQLRQIEDVQTSARVATDDRQTERTDSRHNGDLFSARWEIDDECVRIAAEFDLDVRCGRCGGFFEGDFLLGCDLGGDDRWRRERVR